MRRASHALIWAGLWFVFFGVPASAQYTGRRQGFWFGLGYGYASANASCDGCVSGSRVGGVGEFLTIGGTPSPQVLLGVTVDGWTHARQLMGNLVVSLYYYPHIKDGFYLEGGLGVSTYRLDTSPGVTGAGFGLTLALGYDVPIGRNASLSPRAAYSNGVVGDLSYVGATSPYRTGWKQDFLFIGLTLTSH